MGTPGPAWGAQRRLVPTGATCTEAPSLLFLNIQTGRIQSPSPAGWLPFAVENPPDAEREFVLRLPWVRGGWPGCWLKALWLRPAGESKQGPLRNNGCSWQDPGGREGRAGGALGTCGSHWPASCARLALDRETLGLPSSPGTNSPVENRQGAAASPQSRAGRCEKTELGRNSS